MSKHATYHATMGSLKKKKKDTVFSVKRDKMLLKRILNKNQKKY